LKFKLRQLEAFRAVAETGSMTRAAKKLEISQPAVTRLLSDFSNSIGFELFQRRKGILEPTSDSKYLLSVVSRIIDNLEHLEDLRRDLTERTVGHIRIACLPGFATSHLPGVLVKFLKERPGVTVSLEPDRPERILEWIIGEQYDCGLTGDFSGHQATISENLNIRSVCILPEGHLLGEKEVITPLDLIEERLIHTRRDSWFFTELVRAFGVFNVEINSWVEVRQFNTACMMIKEGLGASVVSALDADVFRSSGIIIKPFEPKIYHRLSIIQPASGPSSPVVLDFIDAFRESLEPYVSDLPS